MRKIIIRPLTFLLALFIGLSVYDAWYFPADKPVQEFPIIVVNVLFESAPDKINSENTNGEFYDFAPCVSQNPMKQYKYSRKIKTIEGGVVNGWITCGILPEYSQTAKAINVSGEVILDVLVDETGEIIKASVESGNPSLREAALKAAYQSRTPPRLLGGQPVKVRGILVYQFDNEHGVSLPRHFPIKNSYR